jgi:4a-hydroxytetrahydrobiopterin dehydratase
MDTRTGLIRERCVACRRDSPRVTEEDVAELHPAVREWQLIEADGMRRLDRVFKFEDFAGAMAFASRVGAAADEDDHHPRITVEWGRVNVTWWTHKIKGLHRNDFIMAAKTDALFARI